MDDERLMRLEETTLFCDRRLDELAEQVLALSGRVEALGRRLARFELVLGRLAATDDPPASPDDPPPANPA